jgi:hypothetical protein
VHWRVRTSRLVDQGPPRLNEGVPQKNLKASVSVRGILAIISPPLETYQYSEVLAAFLLGPLHASDQLHKWIRQDKTAPP